MKPCVSATLLLVAIAGCQADDPAVRGLDSGTTAPPSALTVEPREDCPQVDPSAYIFRVDAPGTTSAQRQAIRGVAVGAGDVIARTGDGLIQGIGTAAADGRFCVEATLVANTQNQVELIPRLPDGCWGQPRTVLLTHQFTSGASTSTTPVSQVMEAQNIALGRTVSSPDFSDDSGSGPMAVTDGYTDSYAVLSIWDPLENQSVWVSLDLGAVQSISEFRIDWDPGTTDNYATHYSIYTSVAAEPGDPTLANSTEWRMAVDVPNASWGTQQRRVGGLQARWVALVLHSDNDFITDTFHLAEFGVYSAVSQGIPIGSTNSDTCP